MLILGFCLFLFFLPSNLFLKLPFGNAYVHGLQVDYLIPKLYLSEVIALGLLAGGAMLWLLNFKKLNFAKLFTQKNRGSWLTALVGFWLITSLAVRQAFTAHPTSAYWFLGELGLASGLGWWLYCHNYLWHQSLTRWTLLLTLNFQAVLAWYQFQTQHSFLPYYWLGEPNLRIPIGLATSSFGGAEKILPYGTTAHPNVLAGVLVGYWLIVSYLMMRKKQPELGKVMHHLEIGFYLFTTVATFVTLWLTQSWSAGLTLSLGILGLWWKRAYLWGQTWSINLLQHTAQKPVKSLRNLVKQIKLATHSILLRLGWGMLISLFLALGWGLTYLAEYYPDNLSLTRRAYLQEAAWQMIIAFPVNGVGLNQFTAQVENFSPNPEVVRFVQPVHHIGWLWLAETGLLGVALFVWGGWILCKVVWGNDQKVPRIWSFLIAVVVLMPIASLDHYLLTLPAGRLLVILLFNLSFIYTVRSPQH